MPFMSTVRRVRSLLHQIDKRSAQSASSRAATKQKRDRILAAAMMGVGDAGREEVTIKGSGRAVDKVLSLAAWFGEREKEEGVKVRLQTGSVWAIDDIVAGEDERIAKDAMDQDLDVDEIEDIPESRLRQISVLEVKISLR
jgi:ribonuclease P/MRP protein subunit POP7